MLSTLKALTRPVALTLGLLLSVLMGSYAQSVLNPADPIENYNSSSPKPIPPQFNQIFKWVRTPRSLGWNTNDYKAYYVNGFGFRLMYPSTYAPAVNDGKKYPLIIMFHGRGELGTVYDNELQLTHGALHHLNARNSGKFDGYALFMQNRTGDWGSAQYNAINVVIDYMVANNKVDPDRVVIHGLSAGGRGAWQYLIDNPKRVAAAAPMSAVHPSYSSVTNREKIKFIPTWLFQGGLDNNPVPELADQVVGELRSVGANIKYTLYPNAAHTTWYNAYDETDFYPFLNRAHKANPWILFEKNTYCQESPVSSVIGVTAGFDGYEWRRNGELIPGANSNTISVTQGGSYSARIKRGTVWSDWSPVPAVVNVLPEPPGPTISIVGNRSRVLPAPDGATTVDIEVSNSGGGTYRWYKQPNVNTVIATSKIYKVTAPGTFTAKSTTALGCLTLPATNFVVVNANGPNKPDIATKLQAIPSSESAIRLEWQQSANPAYNETGFEIYRATAPGGPYQFVTITAADATTYTNTGLIPNTTYYYVVRAVNETAAALLSNEASAVTVVDNVKPQAPVNVIGAGTTENSISLSWGASTDNVGVVGYDIYMDGVKIGSTTTELTYTATGLTRNQGYNFYVVARDAAGNLSTQSNLVRLFAIKAGLSYKYYHGAWDNLPNFANLTPVKTGRSNNVTLTPRTQDDNFGFLWEGFIKISAGGSYTFRTNSDDGSKLYLSAYSHNATALVNNDGLHGSQNRDGTITLTAGIYPIAITFFERGGGESITVSWRVPGSSNFVVIPDSVFVDYAVPPASVPAAPTNLAVPSGPRTFNSLQLTWTDASSNETGFEIYRSPNTTASNFRIVHTTAANVTSYTDGGLTPNTRYYYRVRAVNAEGASGYTSTANNITLVAPAAPAAPSSLTGSVVNTRQIDLSFSGVAQADVSFGIYRSSTYNPADYLKIGSVAGQSGGGTVTYSYTDNTVTSNTQYNYRVRAEQTGANNSGYSNTLTLSTSNTAPVFTPRGDVFVRSDKTLQVNLSGTDADGDQLSFTGTTLPPIASIQNVGNNTAVLTVTPVENQFGTFPVTVSVSDGQGGSASLSFNIIVNNNAAPIVSGSPGSIYTINEGESTTFTLTATDAENDPITWTTTGLPAFGSTENVSANALKVNLNPYFTDAGEYPVTITADDGKGGVVETNVLVRVMDAEAGYHIYINFNHENNQAGVPTIWNSTNGGPFADGVARTFSGLKSATGTTTSVSFRVTNPSSVWSNAQYLGNAATGGIYPEPVIRSVWRAQQWANTAAAQTPKTIEFSGLNPNYRYSFVLFSHINEDGTKTVQYKVGDKTAVLNAARNINQTAQLTDLIPSSDGKLLMEVTGAAFTGSGTHHIYLNAMEIIATINDNTLPIKPTEVAVQETMTPSQRTTITWKDQAFNESSYQVFRSTAVGGPFTGLTQLASNSSSFVDQTVGGNITYYYFVQAANANGATNSDTVSITTSNVPPVLDTVLPVVMRVGGSKTVVVRATDTEGETIRLTAQSMPSFMSFVDAQNGTGWFTILPGSGDEGKYTVRVIARDQFDASVSRDFTVTVIPFNENRILVNMNGGASTNESAPPYNNVARQPNPGFTLPLVNTVGESTGVSVQFLDNWDRNNNTGLYFAENRWVFGDVAMTSYISSSSANSSRIKLTNLPAGKRFTLYLYSSRVEGSPNETNSRLIQYTINGASQQVQVNNNTSIIRFNELIGNANRELEITISKVGTTANDAITINAMGIDIADNNGKPSKPTEVFAGGISRNQIRLNWRDNSGYELGYRVYRSTSLNGSYTMIASLPANTTTYVDASLTADTRYYYKVLAYSMPVSSDLSDAATARTFISSTYVNFNQDNNAPLPWNNTNRPAPSSGNIISNLRNEFGTTTSVGLELEPDAGFSTTNVDGVITGNNSGIFPDNVMRQSYVADVATPVKVKITGLDPSLIYDLTMFASRGSGGGTLAPGSVRLVDYIVDGDTVRLDAAFNSTKTVTKYNARPSSNGEIILEVAASKGIPGQPYGYIGALLISPRTDDTGAPGTLSINQNNTLAARVQDQPTEEQGTIAAYPNPFNSTLSIDLETPVALKAASVAVYNMAGRAELVRVIGDLPAGRHQIRVPVAQQSLQRGLYILQVTDKNGFRKVIKVLKQ